MASFKEPTMFGIRLRSICLVLLFHSFMDSISLYESEKFLASENGKRVELMSMAFIVVQFISGMMGGIGILKKNPFLLFPIILTLFLGVCASVIRAIMSPNLIFGQYWERCKMIYFLPLVLVDCISLSALILYSAHLFGWWRKSIQ